MGRYSLFRQRLQGETAIWRAGHRHSKNGAPVTREAIHQPATVGGHQVLQRFSGIINRSGVSP